MKASVVNGREASSRGASSSGTTDSGLDRDGLLHAYRTMLLSRKLDDKEIQLKNQSQYFFQISCAGHEAVLVAAGLALRPGYDWFYPYYRDRALCLQLGMPPLDMLLAGTGAASDPSSGGRQMPSHWSSPALHIVSQSSAVTTQALQAVGAAEAGRLYGRIEAIPGREERFHGDEVVYVSLGDGATSEGEFWESLNTACTERLPVLYLVEDNGYAISVPVEFQTPGGDVSKLVSSFPALHVESVDGTDLLESVRAMRTAVDYVRAGRGPALVHARVIRPYSHSLSDDEKLYKPPSEREAERHRDPIARFGQYLKANGYATDQDLAGMARDIERELNEAAQAALAAPKPAKATAARFVYSPDTDPTSAAFETAPAFEGNPDTMVAAINRTLKDEMARDARIVVFGEDVADASRTDSAPARAACSS
jgi:2-oxoisovalerate dehydrogenase E1 component